MVVGSTVTLVSLLLRATAVGHDGGTVAVALSLIGFLILAAGAYVGGDVVFVLGNMVSRHAFRGPGTKWIRLDTGDVTDLATLPEATPTKMRAGINDLVIVRLGDSVHALHAVCAHAGGPLAEGRVTPDGCVECPWHQSRFRLADGRLRHGPAVYDQPAYEIRMAESGGYEVRRTAP
jgi:nitrite reductase/ring-hydroxylating ferredoxin subunit